jgi:ketosteroid isomerase-like protein
MADHPNAATYRKAAEAMNAGQFEGLADGLADDVVWWMIGVPEPVRGKEALMAMMSGPSDFEIKVDLHDVVANDDHLVALVQATATRGARTLTYRTAEIHHIKDGKLTERWAFSDDTEAIKEFFA